MKKTKILQKVCVVHLLIQPKNLPILQSSHPNMPVYLAPKSAMKKTKNVAKSLCSILTHTAPKSDKKRNQKYCNQVIPVCVLT